MDVKKYEVFEKTVEKASLTRAAEDLGLTQSGVSHIIAAVEAELELPLLRRTRTGARLTPEGEAVIPFIREIVSQEQQLRQKAAQLRAGTAGSIRIGTFTSVATHWLPGMMQSFQTAYPGVEFRLFNGDYHDVDGWLRDGSVDLGFVALPLSDKDWECIVLRDDPLLAVLPKGHPLAGGEVCRVEELAREPFISLLESSDHDARRALEQYGAKPNVKYSTKDDYAVMAMVGQGMGVSVMPSLLLRGHQENLVCLPLAPASSRTLALALPAGEKTGPAARRFAEFAAEWVRENG